MKAMNGGNEKRHAIPTFIRRLMPDASESELQEGTNNLTQYLSVVRRIFERMQRDASIDSQSDGEIV